MPQKLDVSMLIPRPLRESADYEALTAKQREGLRARLLHAHELIDSAVQAANASGEAQRQAILDLELDAMTIISVVGEPDKTVSAWIVHSSWTFECSDRRLADYIDPAALGAASAPQLSLESSAVDISRWLREWSQAVQNTFRRLSGAKAFCEAIAQLLAIDMLTAALLTSIALLHVSGHLKRH